MPSFKDYFNSNTMTGRANVAKATYASIAIWYLWHRARKPKKTGNDPPPPPSPPTKHEHFNECCEIKPEPKCGCNESPTYGQSPLDDGCRYGNDSTPPCGPSQGQSGDVVRHTKASALMPEPVPTPADVQKSGNLAEPRPPQTTPNQRKHISIWFD